MPRGTVRTAQTAAAVDRVAGRLYDVLSGEDGNVAFSPWAVANALTMVVDGAHGRTQGEILQLMQVADGRRLALDMAQLRREARRASGHVAVPFVALVGQAGTEWSRPYLAQIQYRYGATVHEVDYAAAPEHARREINALVATRTRGAAAEALRPGAVDRSTRLTVLSGLDIDAAWPQPFETTATPRAFHHPSGVLVVPTMTTVTEAGLGGGAGWRSLELLLLGGRVALTVIVPEAGAMRRVEGLLSTGGSRRLLQVDRTNAVRVDLPRWTSRARPPLQEAFRALGMRTVFTPGADLHGLASGPSLRLDRVVHEVVVRADERGLGVPGTAREASGGDVVVPNERFRVDRPFLFVLHTREHHLPLLVGRVVDPEGER